MSPLPDSQNPGWLLNGQVDEFYLAPPPYVYPPPLRHHLRQLELTVPQQQRVLDPSEDQMPAALELVETIDELIQTNWLQVPGYRLPRFLLCSKLHYELLELYTNAYDIGQETLEDTLASLVTPQGFELQLHPLTRWQEEYLAVQPNLKVLTGLQNCQVSTSLLISPGGVQPGNLLLSLQVLTLNGKLWVFPYGQKLPSSLDAEGLTRFYFPSLFQS